MEPVTKRCGACRIIVVLLFSLLLLFIYPSISDKKDTILTSRDKKFINHYFNATEFHRKGEFDRALNEYKKAYEYDTSNTIILNCIGRVYWKMGELKKAIDVYHQVLKQSDDSQAEAKARSSLGVIYMEQGRYEKALEEMQRCLDLEQEPVRQISYKTIINKCQAEID